NYFSGWNNDANNTPLGKQPIPVDACPSTGGVRIGLYNNGANNVFAYGDYFPIERGAPAAGPLRVEAPGGYSALPNINRSPGTAEVYREGVYTKKIAEITDGTSNSLLLVEDAGRPQIYRAGKRVGNPDANPTTESAGGGAWIRPSASE